MSSLNLNDVIVRKICDRMPVYPRSEDPNLSYNLYRRKELYDYKLDPPSKENTVVAPTASTFTPLKTQELEMRIFSPYTPYRRALFFHGVGTGKSALFSMIVENNRAYHNAISEGLTRKPALILSPNRDILDNYLKDIRRVGDYEPPMDRFTTKESQMDAVKNLVKSAYEFLTIGTFINLLIRTRAESEEAWNELIEKYSARIIVIDEVHKISTAGETSEEEREGNENDRYIAMHEFLHQVKGCKIFLLSATPVWDNISEFPLRMNLILDSDKQLPDDFQNTYFYTDPNDKERYNTIREDKYDELMSIVGPYISYIRPDESDVEKVYEGMSLPEWNIKYTKINVSKASEYQEYWIPKLKEISKDLRKNKSGTPKDANKKGQKQEIPFSDAGRTEEISASNFIFCGNLGINESFCSEGCFLGIDFNKYTEHDDSPFKDNWPCLNFYHKHIIQTEINKNKKFAYGSKELGDYIKANIEVFAPKIKHFIDIIENKSFSQELVFAYNEGVTQPGGCYNMGLLLQLFDWKWRYANPNLNAKTMKQTQRLASEVKELSKRTQNSANNNLSKVKSSKTFIVLTGDIMPRPARTSLLQEFNSESNVYGQKIRLVIGSQAIGTGIDIKNVRQFHVMSAHWNRSAIDQSEGRVYRTGSHAALGDDERFLKVYNHALVFENNPSHGIDIEMYVENENKTAPLANLVRLIKRAAYDCPLTYKRNVLEKDREHTLACDLQRECNYECRGFPESNINKSTNVWSYLVEPQEFITSTAIENYSSDETKAIEEQIASVFARTFSIKENRLINSLVFTSNEDLPGYNHGIARSALRRMRISRVPIVNKYGFVSYLGNFDDVWYLTDDPYHTLYSDLESVNCIRAMYDNNLGEILDVESLSVPLSCNKDITVDENTIGGKIWELFNTYDDKGNQKFSQDLYTDLTNITTGDIGIKINEMILQNYLSWEKLHPSLTPLTNPLEKLKHFVLTRKKKDYYEIRGEGGILIGFFHIAYGDKKDIPKKLNEVAEAELKQREIRSQLAKYIRTQMGVEPPVVKTNRGDQEQEEDEYSFQRVYDHDEEVINKYVTFIAEYVQANNIRPNPLIKLVQADMRTPLKIVTGDNLAWRTVNKGSLEANLCFTSKNAVVTVEVADNNEYYGQMRNKSFFIIPPASKSSKPESATSPSESESSTSSSPSSSSKPTKAKKKTKGVRAKTGQTCTTISTNVLFEIIEEKEMVSYFAKRMEAFEELFEKGSKEFNEVFGKDINEANINTNFKGEACGGQNANKCVEVKKMMDKPGFLNEDANNKLKILYYFTLRSTQRLKLCRFIQKWLEMNNLMK